MDEATCAYAAFDETVVFLRYFNDLKDPRQRGKVTYPLSEILLLCLTAVLAGAESITAIARFRAKRLELLRRFAAFKDGTPAHDHLGDILASLDAEQFQGCFAAWVAAVSGISTDVIAIDGKTCAARITARRGQPPSTWFRPSPPVSDLCSARPRSRKNPMKSSPSRSC